MCFQWAFKEAGSGFGDNGSYRNSNSVNSGLYFFQVCSSKAYFVCQDRRWRSMILKTHLREVSQYFNMICGMNYLDTFFSSTNAAAESTRVFLN